MIRVYIGTCGRRANVTLLHPNRYSLTYTIFPNHNARLPHVRARPPYINCYRPAP